MGHGWADGYHGSDVLTKRWERMTNRPSGPVQPQLVRFGVQQRAREWSRSRTRDSNRAAAPLQKGTDAVLIDTTNLSVADAIAQVLALYKKVPRAP